jgi:cytoskeletal protein CcmA (bactofilin family)
VVLEKTARVTGDILHKSLSIEQGAFLEGMCKRIDSSPAAAAPLDKGFLAKPAAAPKDRVIGLGGSEPLVPTDKAVVN